MRERGVVPLFDQEEDFAALHADRHTVKRDGVARTRERRVKAKARSRREAGAVHKPRHDSDGKQLVGDALREEVAYRAHRKRVQTGTSGVSRKFAAVSAETAGLSGKVAPKAFLPPWSRGSSTADTSLRDGEGRAAVAAVQPGSQDPGPCVPGKSIHGMKMPNGCVICKDCGAWLLNAHGVRGIHPRVAEDRLAEVLSASSSIKGVPDDMPREDKGKAVEDSGLCPALPNTSSDKAPIPSGSGSDRHESPGPVFPAPRPPPPPPVAAGPLPSAGWVKKVPPPQCPSGAPILLRGHEVDVKKVARALGASMLHGVEHNTYVYNPPKSDNRLVSQRAVQRVDAPMEVKVLTIRKRPVIPWALVFATLYYVARHYARAYVAAHDSIPDVVHYDSLWAVLLARLLGFSAAIATLCLVAKTAFAYGRWILGFGPVEHYSYVPHMLSELLCEYNAKADLDLVRSTCRQKMRRLACLPIPDVDAALLMSGTEEVLLAVMKTDSFTARRPALAQ